MTIFRWLADPRLSFPQPIRINGRRYWRIADLQAFEERQASKREALEAWLKQLRDGALPALTSSEDVARQTDASEIAQTAIDFQMRRLLARFDFSPERALAVAELAFTTTGRRA